MLTFCESGIPFLVPRDCLAKDQLQHLSWSPCCSSRTQLSSFPFSAGTVHQILAMPIAQVLHALGAGRTKEGQRIQHQVGAELLVSVGERVRKGMPWIWIHCVSLELSDANRSTLQSALIIKDTEPFVPGPKVVKTLLPKVSEVPRKTGT
nr:PREDICTED: thymidine phosphorylase-like [Anolis carolinensis]|eukprot:XP_008118343.2 PREDICTED: thymidine phosphorylase-like [Anolis carolinensis]